MSKYRLTKLAEHDLEKIWDYTVYEWSLDQAEKYIDGLLSSFEAIGEGRIEGKAIDSVVLGYRKVLHGKHYIFFRFSHEDVVDIVRILHISMDIERHL
ncbi:type II toxin-antitoxin system RelE/ParE family toxin [Dyadobacter sp. CY356]|uniref:type II toxin-antitoxin system RelE/ParE family toxin n=1 Tax=Dyadobacter sp. CY356 TaxID=2906442 RepID=UPI001F317185|nr:type II toxin-antitoxin system RelE/ParE family toxin [Dyadobacter sp. CY356]MCF0056309.1 type II toxin-antitoxin system RelE/ParE family toxin [Dyadobacter sp. CY356]